MSIYYVAGIPYGQTTELYHFGRKGMKWGQNIFTKWATAARARGWDQLASFNTNVAKGFNSANEYINADRSRRGLERAIQNRYDNRNERSTEYIRKAREVYDRTLPGQLSKLYSNVTGAYSEAAKKIGGLGMNIEEFGREVMQRAYAKIEYGQQLAAKYGPMAVKNIKKAGEASLKGAKKFIESIKDKVEEAKEKKKKTKKKASSSTSSSSSSSSSSKSSKEDKNKLHGSVVTKDLESTGTSASNKDNTDFLEKYKYK